MEAVLDPSARFRVEDLLNFSLDVDDDEKDQKTPSYSLESSNPHSLDPDDHQSLSLPEFAEEELEWLANKDAFPAVETCLDILSGNPGIVPNHHSPVSVLENTSTSTSTSTSTTTTTTSCCGGHILGPVHYPVKARSTRQRRRRCSFSDLPSQQWWGWAEENIQNSKKEFRAAGPPSAKIGRQCRHCLVEKTPQWRAGPMGPKTLCNACGVRYKSGRLVPEYRPASSPTFSSLLHSNSHRKVIEMRKQKQMGDMVLNEACGYIVG